MALAAMAFTATALTGCKDDPAPTPDPVKVTSVAFKATPTAALEVGAEFTFEVTVLPENAENKNVTWASSNTAVATVSAGKVTAVAAGKTTISATAADGSGKKAEFEVTVNVAVTEPTVTIAFAEGLNGSGVNEIKFSEALDADGDPAKDLSVTVAATDNIASITLKLTTDNDLINEALAQMHIADGFELGTLPAQLAGALAGFFGDGLPTGEAVVGKPSVKLDFSAVSAFITGGDTPILGGVDQFDIEINAADANGLEAETKTLKLKFVDDVTEWCAIEGDGFDIAEEQVINKSKVADAAINIDITSLAGIDKFLLDIDNAGLNSMLNLAGLGGEFDLANLTPAQEAAMGTMGTMGLTLPFGDEVKGETKLGFELGSTFFTRLFGLGGGPTTFKMTVEDAAGHSVTETLTLNLVDDLKVEITGAVGEDPIEINMSDALADPIAIDPVAVDVVAPQGIETFVVEIDSSSDAFMTALTIFKITGAFDLADPGEELAASLTTVGLLDPEKPIKDATEVTFDVTKFIPLIFQVRSQMSQETGDFTADFKLTVTDKKGTAKEATIKLSLIDDSAAE